MLLCDVTDLILFASLESKIGEEMSMKRHTADELSEKVWGFLHSIKTNIKKYVKGNKVKWLCSLFFVL